jgi:ABC-type dipeptide/oligopeptide/nickel transport system permease component
MNRMRTMRIRLRIASVPLFIAGCVLLYYGSAMLFLVPGDPYESYWQSMFTGRFVYGILPALASVILLMFVGWLWDRSSGSLDLGKTIGRAFLFAVGAIVLFWIGMIIRVDIRDGFR